MHGHLCLCDEWKRGVFPTRPHFLPDQYLSLPLFRTLVPFQLKQVYQYYSALGTSETDDIFTISLEQVRCTFSPSPWPLLTTPSILGYPCVHMLDNPSSSTLLLRTCQLWELCRHCKLFDRRVTVAEVNRMLQQLRARHTDAVFQSFVARTKFG